MSSVSFSEISEGSVLSIPEGVEKLSIKKAAMAYASSGWYVLPVSPGSKNPGSYVGRGWHLQSTKNSAEIETMFGDRDLGIALHVGKSGALVVDVDRPDELPNFLEKELQNSEVPFQSTRLIGDSRRGHYFFKLPIGLNFGNSTGGLTGNWGDVRGNNGVVIVAPSVHASGGHYSWKRTGKLPKIPDVIAGNLCSLDARTVEAASIKEVADFIQECKSAKYPELLARRMNRLISQFGAGVSRHTLFLNHIITILKDSKVEFYDAEQALNWTHRMFNAVKHPSEQSFREYEGMVCWGVAQVNVMSTDELSMHAFLSAPHLDSLIIEWVKKHV